jgi:hypothetical protein
MRHDANVGHVFGWQFQEGSFSSRSIDKGEV